MKGKMLKLNAMDWFLIVAVVVFCVVENWNNPEPNAIAIITFITGVISVMLAAKGHILNFAFGALNSILFAYVSYKSSFFGQVALNFAFFLPLQFVGFYMWRKHIPTKGTGIIETRRLSNRVRLIGLVGMAAAIAIFFVILKAIDGRSPSLDSASTVFSVVAMIIALMRYNEQWWLWVEVNIITVLLWITSLEARTEFSVAMIGMRALYLINSVYGLINWHRLSRN